MTAKYPVFIIGSPRSGTSALIDALLSAGYKGYREGNFLQLMPMIGAMIDRHFATFGQDGVEVMATHVDLKALKEEINEVFAGVVNRLHPTPPWVDKSGNPEMMAGIPALRKLWPDSHFIFAKRRAIENVVSRMKKFSHHNFEYHCRDWARNMTAWRGMRENVPEGKRLEVDQQDMIQDPAGTAMRLAAFLDLSDERSKELETTFVESRPQQTSAGTAERVLSLSNIWSEPERATFMKICSGEMQAFGYSYDEKYWNAAPPAVPLSDSKG